MVTILMKTTGLNNRELSWLSFNERVLQEAMDSSVPLVQRLRFVGIFANNLDEFFRVRVASIKRIAALSSKKKQGNLNSEELLKEIQKQVIVLQQKLEKTYLQILSEMKQNGLHVVDEKHLSSEQAAWLQNYFSKHIRSFLIPLMLNKRAKLPHLQDDSIYLGVKISKSVKDEASFKYAIIEIPSKTIPRFLVLPQTIKDTVQLIYIDDVIRLCLERIFFMFDFDVIEAYSFKISRDAELDLDDDLSKSLMEKIQESLSMRPYGRPIRLTYDASTPTDLHELIMQKLGIQVTDNVIPGGRYSNFRDLMDFPHVCPDLEDMLYQPHYHPDLKLYSSILPVVRQQDIFLNYPYQSFTHFLDFLIEAAIDPHVKEIYISLYRVANHSNVINALINAARNKKKVTVMIELQARFDEKANIHWSNLLQNEQVRVLHGIEGMKVHSKMVLIKRKEGKKIQRYAYIGTGNFNESTANLYSDFGLFTVNDSITDDIEKIFIFLENTHLRFEYKNLLVSPYQMRQQIESLIKKEMENAKNGKDAFILLKLNSLVDTSMIKLLYKAGNAGVKIRIIVRGICCLQPEVPRLSENIQCVSIVDKLLEHSRMMVFCNNGKNKYYIMSADFMNRNFDRRVEVAVPVYDKKIRQVLRDIFEIQWSDNVKSRNLAPFKLNEYVHRDSDSEKKRSQAELYNYFDNKL